MTLNRLLAFGACALLVGFLAPPASAGEATPFAVFQAVCLAPNADFPAVTAAAESGGWRDTQVTGDTTLPGATVGERLSKATKAGGIPLTLFAWTGTTKSGVHVSACTMRIAKPAFDDLQSAAAGYTGFPAQDGVSKKAVFHYTSSAGTVTAVDKTGFDAAAAGGGLNILTVSGDVHGSMLDLLKIKK